MSSVQEDVKAIVDKHVDQEAMFADLVAYAGAKAIIPALESIKAKVISGELDLIGSTEVDDVMIIKAVDFLLAKVK
jgi:hypothetical protein